MCQFVKKKKKVLCLVEHMSTKKWPTLFFQPCTVPPTINNFYNEYITTSHYQVPLIILK